MAAGGATGTALEGKVGIVTGGLSGIGRAIAERFAREGAALALLDSRERSRDDDLPAEEVVGRLGPDAVFLQGDVSDEVAVDRLFAAALERFGRLDLLVNNAGVSTFKPIEAFSVEEFDRLMAINVRGTFLCCRRAVPQMRRQSGRGVIVNVASNFAFVAAAETAVYSASKGAVVTLTKGIAIEAAGDGIRVNALCPGATATEFNRAHRERPEVVADWEARTPLRTVDREDFLAAPADIASCALFLATDASRYMTGAALVADGGWNAQ